MKNDRWLQSMTALVLIVLLIEGCTRKAVDSPKIVYGDKAVARSQIPEYTFSVHPLHNSRKYFDVYQPLVDYINHRTSEFRLRLEASKDYGQYEEKLLRRQFHFTVPNPYQSLLSVSHGYRIIGKMGDDEKFYGIIVVRKDSHISSVQDLRQSSISFPSATALAAAMMPKYFLQSNGLNIEKDVECLYVGSQESSIMNVYLGKTKAGCTWPPPWESFLKEHPEIEKSLTVRWRTKPLINNGVAVRNDVDPLHEKIFTSLLFSLQESEEGRTILQRINVSRYERIAQEVYVARVKVFLDDYQTMFGSLPHIGTAK